MWVRNPAGRPRYSRSNPIMAPAIRAPRMGPAYCIRSCSMTAQRGGSVTVRFPPSAHPRERRDERYKEYLGAQGLDAGQGLALHPFQKGAAGGGDEGHVVHDARMV